MSEFLWKKEDLACSSQSEKKRRVLVLYTGGTIGMKWTEKGYSPVKDYFEDKIQTYPMLKDTQYVISSLETERFDGIKPIPLPLTIRNYRILYGIKEYTPLLDSSNMSMTDWAYIASDIRKYYAKFDAFVILHGTDTMAYTASALSFMLENLGKTIILTGSQIPLSELRSDGRDNLLESLIIAGEFVIPEVLESEEDEPQIELKVSVSGSLKSALARLKVSEQDTNSNNTAGTEEETKGSEDDEIPIGTQCKHGGCQATYLDPDSNLSDCQYHPGIPIFHEGYKLWSCCQKRTSDFNEFLRQEGCTAGNHLWKANGVEKPARCDWHQTGSQIIISVFSKCSLPEASHFTANKTSVNAVISYEGGKRTFQKTWRLEGVIDPEKSKVELLGTKAEIKLRKFDGTPWKYLELRAAPVPKKTDNNDESNEELNDD